MPSVEAPAKINLGLHILCRRRDGFHDLESLFLKIGWSDTLDAESGDTLSLTCSDPSLPTDNTNLVVRAAQSLQASCGNTYGARLHLEKRIPYEAGLGGGSSDAATALKMLALLWNVNIADDLLIQIGASIGSDVPFFLGGETALVRGRGEIVEPLQDYRFPYALVVVKPTVSVSTREAYRNVVPHDTGRVDICDVVLSNDPERWCRELVNDFESSVFPIYPELSRLKQELARTGAAYASMSGSGSAIFGAYEDLEDAESAADQLRAPGRKIWWGNAD